jgi:predicted SnoaL-like aldol condensation-catalyzing enzyme
MTKQISNKENAIQFLQLVVDGRIEEAYQKYVDMNGRHHNIHFPAGFASLKEAMIENHSQFPNKKLSIKKVLEDGELVATYSQLILTAGKELAVVHILRFQESRIVEMWDCGQLLPEKKLNQDGAF